MHFTRARRPMRRNLRYGGSWGACLLAALLVAAALAGCQPQRPQPAPEPGRAAIPPSPRGSPVPQDPASPASPTDASSPQVAAAELVAALDAREAPAVRAAFHAPTAKEAMLADALAPLLVSARRLQQATGQRFGPQAARRLGAGVARLDPYFNYAAAGWKVQGDRALFDADGRTMVRTAGRWKLTIPEARQADTAAIQTARAWQREAQVMARTAAEVESGRYATDEELVRAFTQRVANPPDAPG